MFTNKKLSSPRVRQAVLNHGVAGFINERGPQYIEKALAMSFWEAQHNVFTLNYEDILGRFDLVVRSLARWLNLNSIPSDLTLARISQKSTLTRSDDSERLEWDDKAETAFAQLGGLEANKRLGYQD
jgi:hypothetical protein